MTGDQLHKVREMLLKAADKQQLAYEKALETGENGTAQYHAGVCRGLSHALLLLGGFAQ